MRILLIHTAGNEGSAALADTELSPPMIATELLPGRTSSERLMPTVRSLLETRGWELGELTAVVVVHGPGSFTGVRVGVAAAKGLSEAAGIPLIGVSRLALLAGSVDGVGEQVHAVLDAGRGEFYYGRYLRRHRLKEKLMSASEVIAAVAGGVVVACEAKIVEALPELAPRLVAEPLAGNALSFALDRIAVNDFDDVATLDANYLRRTDAEIFAKPVDKTIP